VATEQPALPDREVRQEVRGDHNIVVGVGNVVINKLQSPDSSLQRQQLEILLDRVDQFWIKGVLEASAHGAALLELGKEALAGVVEHPWEKILEVPGQTDRPLPVECGIGELFGEVGRFLLVLGEPGAGKTTILLELARALLAHARSDWRQPIPVVFNLSSWAVAKGPLAAWLVAELKSKYFVSRSLAEAWLAQSRLLPLLDGLDEVETASQRACVEAVNAFVEESGPPGLAVCSRAAEYLGQSVRLKLNGAVRLLPLRPEQIDEYFKQAGSRLAALDTALRGDPGLQELARSPLMFSVMTLAYQDAPLASLEDRRLNTAEVFSAYIDRMFERKGKGAHPYSKGATVTWLSRLARGLQRESQALFLIEQIQPTWLSTQVQLWEYALASRLLVTVAMVLLVMPLAAYSFRGILFGVFQGLCAGVIDGGRLSLSNRRRLISGWWWYLFHIAATIFLIYLSSYPPQAYERLWHATLFFYLLVAVIWKFPAFPTGILGHLFGLRAQRDIRNDIQPVETLTWSWKLTRKGEWVGFVVGGCIGFFVAKPLLTAVGYGVEWHELLTAELPVLLLVCLFFGIVGAFLGALYGGLNHGIQEGKTRPNQGIVLSVRSGGLAGLRVATFVSIPLFLVLFWIPSREARPPSLSGPLSLGLFGGLVAAFWLGWMDVLQHVALRFVLWRSGNAPLNYPRFLDHAAKLIFLQEVGGGYIFMHRLLLEHFAALEQAGDGS
jgi:eukaryotic-like serine/threonine-protein kinase